MRAGLPKHKTPFGVLLEGVPSDRLCACNSVVSESRVSYQARRLYLHQQRFPSTHFIGDRARAFGIAHLPRQILPVLTNARSVEVYLLS